MINDVIYVVKFECEEQPGKALYIVEVNQMDNGPIAGYILIGVMLGFVLGFIVREAI